MILTSVSRFAAAAAAGAMILVATTTTAHAYVDPGTGSMLLQLGIAAVASVMFYFRSLRMTLVEWLRRRFSGGNTGVEADREVPSVNDRSE